MVYKGVVCPHCGLRQQVRLAVQTQGRNDPVVWFCDVENGGCDEPFILRATVAVTIAVFTLQPVTPAADSLGGQTNE